MSTVWQIGELCSESNRISSIIKGTKKRNTALTVYCLSHKTQRTNNSREREKNPLSTLDMDKRRFRRIARGIF